MCIDTERNLDDKKLFSVLYFPVLCKRVLLPSYQWPEKPNADPIIQSIEVLEQRHLNLIQKKIKMMGKESGAL